MESIVKNRYIDAFLKFLLLSAFVHLLALALQFLIKRNFNVFNYFSIVGLDAFFPQLSNGLMINLVSNVLIIFIYILIFLFFTKKN